MIRLVSPEGKVSVLLTNPLHKAAFPKEELIELYFRRWAVVIMSVIARTLMVITSRLEGSKGAEFQFKKCRHDSGSGSRRPRS